MKLTHLRLLVRDFAPCFRFYRDVLGYAVTFGEEHDRYAEFDTGAVNLALFDRQLMADAVGTSDLAATAVAQDRLALVLAVDNVDEAIFSVKAQDVQIVNEPHDQPVWGIRVAHFRDPDGNLIEINQPLM